MGSQKHMAGKLILTLLAVGSAGTNWYEALKMETSV
jgi:hypothetical protein